MKRSGPANVVELKPWSKNPRVINAQQLEALKRSMDAHGDLGGVVFNLRTKHTVGGHQRIKILDPSWKIEKYAESDKTGTVARGYIITPFGKFSYREVDWPLRKEMAANLAANKISGEWDNAKLAPILQELVITPEFELTGFTQQEANLVIESFPTGGAPEDDDELPPTPTKTITRLGKIWKLGRHRLLCGDATDPESWARLFGKEKAALCITDMPYGVDYDVAQKSVKNRITGKYQGHRSRGKIESDDTTDVAIAILPEIFSHLISEGTAYFTCGTDLEVDIINWLREHQIHYGTVMVWHKHFQVVSWNRYHAEHELIIYAGRGSRPGKYARWFGPKQETTVWDIPLDAFRNRLHPTQKPVALYERPMLNSSAIGEIIVDPCAGSGPLVIAAEKHNRTAYMMDTDPRCCDLIVKRWEEWSGEKAERLTDG